MKNNENKKKLLERVEIIVRNNETYFNIFTIKKTLTELIINRNEFVCLFFFLLFSLFIFFSIRFCVIFLREFQF